MEQFCVNPFSSNSVELCRISLRLSANCCANEFSIDSLSLLSHMAVGLVKFDGNSSLATMSPFTSKCVSLNLRPPASVAETVSTGSEYDIRSLGDDDVISLIRRYDDWL